MKKVLEKLELEEMYLNITKAMEDKPTAQGSSKSKNNPAVTLWL